MKLLLLICLVLGLAACNKPSETPDSKVITGPKQQISSADATARLVGVWTYAQPLISNRAPDQWQRWTFTAANKLDIQTASPAEMAWGEANVYDYEMTRRKTADTGEWYWRVDVKNTALMLALFDNQKLVVFKVGAENNYELKKADKDLSK